VNASGSDRFLIHGRLVCEDCAQKARRRLPWELAALTAWAALLTAIAVGNLVAGNAVAVAALALVGSAIVVPLSAVQAMKLANRRAQRRLAEGELDSLEGTATDNDDDEGIAGPSGGSPETLGP